MAADRDGELALFGYTDVGEEERRGGEGEKGATSWQARLHPTCGPPFQGLGQAGRLAGRQAGRLHLAPP
jgi:hypothetical protein